MYGLAIYSLIILIIAVVSNIIKILGGKSTSDRVSMFIGLLFNLPILVFIIRYLFY